MALSDIQVRQLRAKLDGKHVKTRKANGTDLHYVEGWHVIAEANRIFGYDAWDRRTLSQPLRVERAVRRLSRRSLHRQGPRQRPSGRHHNCAGGIRDWGRQSALPRGKLTSLRSKGPRPMQRSGRSPPLAIRSVSRFMTASSLACAKREREDFAVRSARGCSARPLAPMKQASTSQASSLAPYAQQ